MKNIYQIVQPFLFTQDPEFIHDTTLFLAEKFPSFLKLFFHNKPDKKYQLKSQHLTWNFPIGLAAGFDKNALVIKFFENLGFGAIEFGTVTLKPQAGNPRPRIFRYLDQKNVRNAMGFPNQGSEKILQNLKKNNYHTSIGANIGKNKWTDGEEVFEEYATLYDIFYPHSDYVVINISSPNTPGLRNLQNKEYLELILQRIKSNHKNWPKPLFIKIAPDIKDENIKDIVELALKYNLAGIVATNTTLDHQFGSGGMSGKCLNQKSRDIRKKVIQQIKGTNLDLIGVGGISNFEDLELFWNDGGKFAQIYTSFIFGGPPLMNKLYKDLDEFLKKHQLKNLQQYFDQK